MSCSLAQITAAAQVGEINVHSIHHTKIKRPGTDVSDNRTNRLQQRQQLCSDCSPPGAARPNEGLQFQLHVLPAPLAFSVSARAI
ncbi:hypothetical protein JOQ06_008921 [Pogonophryne albipinna]|uniref:Uncharacterized protein n=1 Tax=Pogonophryne albipinna TaxID=1090488 RepID=A0AAD6BNF4_9TELE|nr:hypothetical protein JOQ06_008921 [Pogonophryne albipinna]